MRRPRPIRAIKTMVSKARRRSASAARSVKAAVGNKMTRRVFLAGAVVGAIGGAAAVKASPKLARAAGRFFDNTFKESPESREMRLRHDAAMEAERNETEYKEGARTFDAQLEKERDKFVSIRRNELKLTLSKKEIDRIAYEETAQLNRAPTKAELNAAIDRHLTRTAKNEFERQLRKRSL